MLAGHMDTVEFIGLLVNMLVVLSNYVCQTGQFDHYGRIIDATAKDKNLSKWQEVAYQALAENYKAFKGSGDPKRLVSGSDDFTFML